ncbi:putative P-loop ATPase [Skermanella aerolata]
MKVKSPGKQPVMSGWQQKCAVADESTIRSWSINAPDCTNTGMLTGISGGIVAADIDVLIPEVAEEISDLASELLGATPLQRIGRAPKILCVYRVGENFRKVKTPTFLMPDGSEAAVEFLAEGQQFVAYGDHPDGNTYRWIDQSPVDVPVDDLPEVDRDTAEAFIECAAQVLRNHGGVLKQNKGKARSYADPPNKRVNGNAAPIGDKFFANVNNLAMSNLDVWVPPLFPGKARFHPGPQSYRVRSEDLGRDLEEDICFHPDGIADWGLEKGLTPIDAVLEHGGAADPKQAAFWLCEKMGVDPISLGWVPPKAKVFTEHTTSTVNEPPVSTPPATTNWYSLCQVSTKGTPLGNHANVMLALRLDPAWQGVIQYDEMANVIMVMKPLPKIPEQEHAKAFIPRPWQDNDVTIVLEWFQLAGLRTASRETIYYALEARARESSVHPVRNLLEEVASNWDNTPRLDNWLSTYLGVKAKDGQDKSTDEYASKVGAMWMIGAVARIFQPGCKVDHMLVLEGEQGARKSTACRILGGQWFSDNLPENVASKDASQHLRGKWIVEMGEMRTMSKTEAAVLKDFITRQIEVYRPSYGRADVYEPRQCVFIGTTNKRSYFNDETGARRFWPVRIGQIDIDALARDRNQLFAEAVHRFRNGEPWYPDADFEKRLINPQQAERYDTDAWEEPILLWAKDLAINEYGPLKKVRRATITEFAKLGLGMDVARIGRAEQNRIKSILTAQGWHKDGPRGNAGERYWYSPTGWSNEN